MEHPADRREVSIIQPRLVFELSVERRPIMLKKFSEALRHFLGNFQMIQHFDKIEKLGVFSNYKKPQGMEPFQRFNLIYGLNGSGKTTLSRFFADLNKGQADGFPELKYKIKTEDGDYQQGNPYPRNIRVFNAEYVDANIGQLEGTLNPIYVIGAENKNLAETVKVDENRLSELTQELTAERTNLKKLEKQKGKIFTDVASKITEAAKGVVTRTYNNRNAEMAYEKLTTGAQLTIADLAEASKAMKQSAMDKLTELTIPQIILGETEKPIFETVNLQQEVVLEILQKSATSSAVERLRKNPALAAWVEGGRELHAHSEDGKCEYCLQIIPEEREAELAAHFNASDAKLKREIERAIGDNKAAYEKVARMSGLSEKALYPEFRTDFLIYSGLLSEEQTKILNHLEALRKALEDKLAKRTESYNAEFPSLSGIAWHEALSSLNDLFRCHNAETDDFQKRLDDNFAKIETHFLSAADHEVKNVKSSIKAVAGQISICTKGDSKTKALGIDDLEIRIETNRAKISNTQQAATALSQKLAAFLGRDDLKFVPEGAGSRIMRFGRAAKRLS